MNVVHLIAKMEGSSPSQNNNDENRASNESSFPFNIFRRAPLFGPIIALSSGRNNGGGENEAFGRSSIRIISSTYSSNERNVEYAPQPTINSDEIRETIAQNLLEVQNIIDYGNYNEFKENNEEKDINMNNNNNNNKEEKGEVFNMNCFDLNKRILAKGQWVDVKDTVDQWLDAQIIEVSEDNTMVKIHYNHWSTRWDEWIKTNSPRIMPFRYHTRQSTLTNYHSPFPNKKPDMGITLLSFEDLNRNSCVHPTVAQQRNRNSSVISASPIQNNNINNSNNPAPDSTSNTNNNSSNTNSNEVSSNNNISTNQNENSNINNIFSISFGRRSGRTRYAEPPPPIPSPKHQEPDPENHIIKNLGEDGFLGVFKEFDQINKVIDGLSSELLSEHSYNTEILTPKKLSEIQNKSYFNIKRLIPILDRTGRIYSDISTFMEHSMKTNQLELLSKNLFADVERINEDLKYFSTEERRRVSQEILSHNNRRENRSGTVNFVPPVNQFEAKLVNSQPILDTPYMTRRNDQFPPFFDFFLNNNEDEGGSLAEENNSNNNNRNQSRNTVPNQNDNNNIINNDFIRNNNVERFNIQFEGNKSKEVKRTAKNKKKKKIKNGLKMLGIKTKRNKSKNNKNSSKEKELKKKKK